MARWTRARRSSAVFDGLEEPVQFFAIVALAILASVAYGVAHDQVTVRISLEYFTIGHPRLIDTSAPTMLGLFWGVVATWWVGLPLGGALAFAARSGTRPKINARHLVGPVLRLLGLMAASALLVGAIAGALARSGALHLVDSLAAQVAADRHARFIAVGGAHLASYVVGAIGGMALALLTWRRRARMGDAVEQAVGAGERRRG